LKRCAICFASIKANLETFVDWLAGQRAGAVAGRACAALAA
jgi:hypothetical protein